MGRKVFVIDVNACIGCHNCFVACKDEFVDHPWLPYSEAQPDRGPSWISIQEVERGQFPKIKISYIPKLCMQCDKPSCARAARDGAVYKRDDGIVIIDPYKSKGKRSLIKACPYGAIYWNEDLEIPQKCTFCAHLLDDGWKEPRCVEVCPTKALRFGEEEEFLNLIAQTERIYPDYGRNTSVYYIGLPKIFIAGSVYCNENGDCLEGAKVSLIDESNDKSLSTITNNYGDFEFEGLETGSTYSLNIEAEGYYKITIWDIHAERDIYLKDIHLPKRISIKEA